MIPPRRRCGIDANQYTYVTCWVKADVAEGQEHQAATLVRRKNGGRLHLRDSAGQKLAYVYFEDEPGGAQRQSYCRAKKLRKPQTVARPRY